MATDILSDIIKVVDPVTFKARYADQLLKDKPESCSLPPVTPAVLNLPVQEALSLIKDCNYTWMELPAVLDPVLPEFPCPSGFSVEGSSLGIRPHPNFPVVDSLSFSVLPTENSICEYKTVFPEDIVIPCYPEGPKLSSTAGVTVNNTRTSLNFSRNPQQPCSYVLTGDVELNIPPIPCPSGLQFLTSTFHVQSSCPAPYNVATTHTAEITQTQITNPDGSITTLPCTYSLNLPDLTIPCYPDGPRVHGSSTITLRDQWDEVAQTSSLGFLTPSTCCDFNLSGDVDIKIACPAGVHFNTGALTVQSTGPGPSPSLSTLSGVEITKSINALHGNKPDACNFDITFPVLDVPCYPNGPVINGESKTYIWKKQPNSLVPTHPGPYSSTEESHASVIGGSSISTSTSSRCSFNLGGITNIELAGFALDCYNLTATGSSSVYTGRRPSNLSTGSNSIGLVATPCGSALVGDIYLDLPDFTNLCRTLTFDGGVDVKVQRTDSNGTQTVDTLIPNAIQLQHRTNPDGSTNICGAKLTGDITLNLPEFNFPCPSGYTTVDTSPLRVPPSSAASNLLQITMDGTPVTGHSLRVEKIQYPTTGIGNACSFALVGNLPLTSRGGGGGGGSSGFSYRRNWTSTSIPAGTMVGILGAEGGRCNYVALQDMSPGHEPPTMDSDKWASLGCDNGRRYHPFKVIPCADPHKGLAGRPNYIDFVKVVPDSKLYGNSAPPIFGLDTPFRLIDQSGGFPTAGGVIYLEVLFDSTGKVPVPVTANIGFAASGWDWQAPTVNPTIPSVYPLDYKLVSPDTAITLQGISHVTCEAYVWNTKLFQSLPAYTPLTGAPSVAAEELRINLLLGAMSAVTVLPVSPRMFKAWLKIADVYVGSEGATAYDFSIPQQGQGTSSMYIKQHANTHQKLVGENVNGVPIVSIRPTNAIGGHHKLSLSIRPGSDALNQTLTFDVVDATSNTPLVVGTGPDDVHVYFTWSLDNTHPSASITTEHGISEQYDPLNPPLEFIRQQGDPAFYLSAIAVHPRYQTSNSLNEYIGIPTT
jgi:hypothetical protein